jgi:1-deoxy-D-xylulose-5-phosphate reductoisomerase
MLAQLSHPDMRLPIQYALTFPERRPGPVRPLELEEIQKVGIFHPGFSSVSVVGVGVGGGAPKGGAWPAVFNGANEVAVKSFLGGGCRSRGFPQLCRRVMGRFKAAKGKAGLATILGSRPMGAP